MAVTNPKVLVYCYQNMSTKGFLKQTGVSIDTSDIRSLFDQMHHNWGAVWVCKSLTILTATILLIQFIHEEIEYCL